MPETHSKPRSRTWALPTFDRIEVVYTTGDLYEDDYGHRDPFMDYMQSITGTVTGIAYADDGGDLNVELGRIVLHRIDLDEVGHPNNVWEVLDSKSGDLEALWPIIDRYCFGHDAEHDYFVPRYVVIPDRLDVVPDARGHKLGLSVLARAIRTWASDSALVALVASPTDRESDDEEATREYMRVGRKKLSRYYQRLGLQPFDSTDNDHAPMLYAFSEDDGFWSKVKRHSIWTSPTHLDERQGQASD